MAHTSPQLKKIQTAPLPGPSKQASAQEIGFLGYHTNHDGALATMRLVELQQVTQREFADDVRVQNEEGLSILGQDLAGQCQRSSRSQRLSFLGIGNLDPKLGGGGGGGDAARSEEA